MSSSNRKFLTRKDIAQMLEVTVEQVRENEVRWGLAPHRRDLNGRCVRYLAKEAIEALRRYHQ